MSWQRNAFALSLAGLATLGISVADAAPKTPKLALTAVDRAPKEGREKPTPAKLVELRKAVTDAPEDRAKRFDLVRGLMAKGDFADALKEAQAWRAKDAYNLVVVRLIGDLYTEMGEKEKARRAYSAVVELVPKDAEAQRALATVLKQGGDLEGAHARLVAASKLSPDDQRIVFELADVAHRLGRVDEAMQRFEAIVAADKVSEAVRYPAKQRLAQIYAAKRRAALEKKDTASLAEAKKLDAAIAKLAINGGTVNDLKVYLSWDTDRTDVDLWVEVPGGEKVFYSYKQAKNGEALFDDVTNGYGPESFTASSARAGTYTVKVNYYFTNRSVFTEARGEVVIILHEGTAQEERHVLPYQLFAPKQTVTVAKIEVHS